MTPIVRMINVVVDVAVQEGHGQLVSRRVIVRAHVHPGEAARGLDVAPGRVGVVHVGEVAHPVVDVVHHVAAHLRLKSQAAPEKKTNQAAQPIANSVILPSPVLVELRHVQGIGVLGLDQDGHDGCQVHLRS